MTIAVIDGGFLKADSQAQVRPKADRFVGNDDFIDKKMDFIHGDTHGSSVLSTMLVKDSSVFIGTAPDAAYWLLRSEDTDTEYPAEEDYWVAALEYADSIGADVITSSSATPNSTIPGSTTHGINLTANRHLFPKQPLWEYKKDCSSW